MRKLFFIALMTSFTFSVFSQTELRSESPDTADFPYWIDMMQDPNANFFETQKAFEEYWEGREVTRGSGYKPFKRWENLMLTRVDEFGNKPNNGKNLVAYSELMKRSERKSANGEWKLLGPVDLPNPESGQPNGLGRINVIAFHPKSENTIYIGAPSGGFWRSFDNGKNWETTTERLPTLGVSAIVVDHKDPNIIYIGTGDRDANNAPGLGVYKSTDGGATWEQKNSSMGNVTVNKLLIHPEDPDIIFAATSSGIYKTENGADSWSLKTSGTSKSMEFKPFDPNVIYAVKSSSLYKSSDNGDSWKKLTNGLQLWERAVIGVSPVSPEYVYVLATNIFSFKALYFSENEGEIFSTKSTTPNIMDWSWNGAGGGGQAFYNLCMVVDRLDSDIIYSGGINIFKSTNQGRDWKINAHWVGEAGAPAVHADHHDIAINPLNNRVYSANDGGLYYTDNGGLSWINISDGISISQIYKIGQSATVRDWILAGNQDNGTSFYDKGNWRVIWGGDGMECMFNHKNEIYRYASLYFGDIGRSTNQGPFSRITTGISDQGAWVTPYVLNVDDPKIMYVGMTNVWRTTNAQSSNVSWKNISSSITNADARMVVVENSPVNSDILYISRDDRKVFKSTNANSSSPSWVQLNNLPYSIITDIEAHPFNENIVYVTAANSNVYKSIDQGVIWIMITANLPLTDMNTIVYDITSNEGLYVGTDIGVFFKDATMINWIYYSDNLPVSVKITELEIYYDNANSDNSILRAATYGRGLWESTLFSENITSANNVRIIEIVEPTSVYQPSDTVKSKFTIKNIGSDVLTTVKVERQLDNEVKDTVLYNINLATYETETITSVITGVSIGSHVHTLRLIDVNGSVISNELSSQFNIAEGNGIRLELNTDLSASQTSWRIIDENEDTLYMSETYVDDSAYVVEEFFNLGTGCYKYIIDDIDGICCTNGSGNYILSNITLNQELGSGATFTISDTVSFCVGEFPDPEFKASVTTTEVDLALTFENKTVDNGYSYVWNFGEGATPQTYVGTTPTGVVYDSDGYKTVSLKATSGNNTVAEVQNDYIKAYSSPIIVTQPISITICPSNIIELNVIAQGFELTYTWYHGGKVISEKIDGLLRVENAQSVNEGEYYCKISNKYFEILTDIVNVSLNTLPVLDVTSNSSELCKGDEITLTASGTGTLYWSNGLGTESVVNDTPEASTTYIVSLTDEKGCVNSKEITVAVANNPTIVENPDNKRLCEDNSVVLIVNAQGGSLNYQWKINDVDFFDGSNILYIDSVKPEHHGAVVCDVSNICGKVVTDTAFLTVDPLPIAAFSYDITDNTVQFIDEALFASKYVWDFGDGTTSTEKEPSHTFGNDNYLVELKVDNDCGSDTISSYILISGLDDNLFSLEKLKIYPNPVHSTFRLEFISDKYIGDVKVYLMNIEGKIIMQQNLLKSDETLSIPFNVSSYSKGFYQLHIILNDRVISRKVIIN